MAKTMTTEQQNIAIAIACGWTGVQRDGATRIMGQHPNSKGEGSNGGYEGIPNYLTDLNAMHEAEKVLSDKGEMVRQCYLDNLGKWDCQDLISCEDMRNEG